MRIAKKKKQEPDGTNDRVFKSYGCHPFVPIDAKQFPERIDLDDCFYTIFIVQTKVIVYTIRTLLGQCVGYAVYTSNGRVWKERGGVHRVMYEQMEELVQVCQNNKALGYVSKVR